MIIVDVNYPGRLIGTFFVMAEFPLNNAQLGSAIFGMLKNNSETG